MPVQHAPYRGPDRRAAASTPVSDYRGPDRRVPGALRVSELGRRALIFGCVLALIIGLGIDSMVGGGDGLVVTFAALRDCAAGVLVLSGSLLVVLWGLTGRAARAYDGSALLLVGGGLLAVGGPWAAWLHDDVAIAMLGPGDRLALGLPALLLLARSVRLVPVDSSVRATHSLTNATATALGLLGIEALLRIAGPIDDTTGWTIVFAALAFGWVGVGLQRVLRPDPRGVRDCERIIGFALVAWGLGDIGLLFALSGNLRWGVVGAAVQLVGSALAAWAAVSLLFAELSHDSTRRLRLAGELADVSTVLADEQTVRQMLLHDARNVVAAIRTANFALERYGEKLDPQVHDQLREAVGSEFTKLQSLLDPTESESSRMRS